MKRNVLILIALLFATVSSYAQKEKKVTFVGGARSVMTNNSLSVTDTVAPDTTTAKRNTGGYALVDLGINIKPNKNTEILGMFRIRNAFGGFWGGGVTYDVRQLYIKGVIANVVRYQLGDLNLKQTPFTLYNHHADAIDSLPTVFNLQRNIVNYEKFYMNNTWRMQGANVDFGLSFNKYISAINATGFISRINATNFANVPERLMAGAAIDVVQSKHVTIGYNGNRVFDVVGTVKDSNAFNNTVHTIDAKYTTNFGKKTVSIVGEIGNSSYSYSRDTVAPKLKDFFVHTNASIGFAKYFTKATIGYLNVGPDFRSIGAQSKDVNYNALPVYYDRYTNTQIQRPLGLLDAIGNENIYNRTISSKLMPANNLFNNAMPYGIATFNRAGVYAKLHYKKDIDANISYYNLSEIKGQGTLALRKFSVVKFNAKVPLQVYIKTKNKLEIQVGANMQNINRTSSIDVEKVNFKSTQASFGIAYELIKDFELIGGYIMQNTIGNEIIADRNAYTEVTYYNKQKYDVQQNILAYGAKYNFTNKIFLSAVYQQAKYTDALHQHPNFNINQFGIIYNMLF